jgi:glucose-1-phosphate thymidylyltransferase
MRGVILAGGMGTRLLPLTKITNKHLLPVYDRPMILYPLETLKRSGITEILIVCGREYAGHFMTLLGSGKEYGVALSYALQDRNNGGIADALSYAKKFAAGEPIAVILGDNIFEDIFKKAVESYRGGAMIFLKKTPNPRRFGVPVFSKDGKRILRVEEKPAHPKSAYAQTGLYLFDSKVFSIIQKLKPSPRGELEVTDTINHYVRAGSIGFSIVKGQWFDAGTIESLLEAAVRIKKRWPKNTGQ